MMKKIIKTIFKDPKSIAKVVDNEAEMRKYVHKNHGLKDGIPTIDLLDLLEQLPAQKRVDFL